MPDMSKIDYIAAVKKSRVVDADRFSQWLAAIDATDATDLAAKMVRDQLLTRWQAKYIMSGRTRLDIGSYRLLERIKKDELGDRFLAIHTQLGRQVDIQILPVDLTKNKDRCESFIQKASATLALDHPHLVHVFDVDQEGGRYFVVTEHLDGKGLDEFTAADLSMVQIATIVSQSISAIQHAHENAVKHGQLRPGDILIDENSSIKIRHFAESVARVPSETPSNDFQSLERIAGDLLEQADSAANEDNQVVAESIRRLSDGSFETASQVNTELSEWLSQHEGFGVLQTDPHNQSSSQTGGFDAPMSSQLATRSKPKPPQKPVEEDSEPEEEPVGFLHRLAAENPVAMIATSCVMAILIVGGSAFAIDRWQSPAKSEDSVVQNSTRQRQTTLNPANLKAGKPETNGGNAESKKKNDNTKSDVAKPQIQSKNESPNFDDVESMKKQIAQAVPGGKGAKKQSQNSPSKKKTNPAAKNSNPSPASANNSQSNVEVAKKTGADAENNKVPTKAKAAPKMAANNGADEKSSSPVANKPQAKKTDQPTKTATVVDAQKNPFTDFARLTSLPDIASTKLKVIDDLIISNRYLLGLELYADPAISKSKVIFELVRSTEDKQKWIVTVRRRAKENPEEVAFFQKADNKFVFQWLPAAEKSRYAPFLRNCLVKLKLPEHSTWLTLRTPILLEPMVLTEDSPVATIDLDIPDMPKTDVVSIEVLPLRVKDLETRVDPSVIEYEQGFPGRILLKKQDRSPFVWVQVNAELRSKLKARAAMVVLLANGQTQAIQSLQDLSSLASALKQQEIVAFQNYQAAKNKRAPQGEGAKYDAIRKELEKVANKAKDQTEKAIEYSQIAPKIFGQPVSIRVYAKLGEHRVELAKMRAPTK